MADAETIRNLAFAGGAAIVVAVVLYYAFRGLRLGGLDASPQNPSSGRVRRPNSGRLTVNEADYRPGATEE